MKKLIQLTKDLAILPHNVMAVQHLDDETCCVVMKGQSAVDEGFRVELPCDTVIDEVNDALKQECVDKAAVEQGDVIGERGTGYEPPARRGPFRCDNCHYYRLDNSSCGQKTMIALSRQPRTSDGRVRVAPAGCCSFIQRTGNISSSDE